MKKKFFKYKSLILEISEDGFSAFLTIGETDEPLSEDDFLTLIKSTGIKYGWENAKAINSEKSFQKEFGKPFLVAVGKKPEIAHRFLFDSDNLLSAKVLDNISRIKNLKPVSKQKVLAKVEFEGEENGGIDVFGNKVSASAFREKIVTEFLGDGVKFLPESKQVIATEAGFPILENGKIFIVDEIIFQGDIIGEQLEFFGNLKVNGKIIDSELTVRGNLTFHSAEKSKIVVAGSVQLKDGIRFCTLLANGEIGGGKDSYIKGGLTRSGQEIKIGSIGSPFAVETNVEITCLPFLKEEMRLKTDDFESEKRYEEQLDIGLEKLHSFGIYVFRTVFKNTFFRIYDKSIKLEEEKKNRVFRNSGNAVYSRIIEDK